MLRRTLLPATLLLALALASTAGAETWKVDKAHTEVKFSIDHFFTPVSGRFQDFEVELDLDLEDPSKTKIKSEVAIGSVDTGNDRRDHHLRSEDWFDEESFPKMVFESRSVEATENGMIAHGDLTIKDRTQRIALPITLLGRKEIPKEMQEMFGAEEVASFRAETTIDRSDFTVGVGNWASDAVVGDEVRIEILVEAHR